MKPYLWALGSIWGFWLVVFVAGIAFSDDALSNTGTLIAYLSWFLGIPVAVALSLLACVAIACEQCSAVRDRRRTTRLQPSARAEPAGGGDAPSCLL